jgi:hypothetical protein
MLFSNSRRQPRRPLRLCAAAWLARLTHAAATRHGASPARRARRLLPRPLTELPNIYAERGIIRRSPGGREVSPRGTLIKLGSGWEWHERRYRPAKATIGIAFTGIDADEMVRIV